MSLSFRKPVLTNIFEMRFIAEMDSRIPLDYDPHYGFTDASIDDRLKFYQQIKTDDFFEVATDGTEVVAFHIVLKGHYPPDVKIGNVITLWVDSNYRGKGIAADLKARAETWAKTNGLAFLQTNVHKNNTRMLAINESNGYQKAYICLRKHL